MQRGGKWGTYSNVGSVKIGNGHWNAFPWYEWMTAGAPLPMMITTLHPKTPASERSVSGAGAKGERGKGEGRERTFDTRSFKFVRVNLLNDRMHVVYKPQNQLVSRILLKKPIKTKRRGGGRETHRNTKDNTNVE